MCERTGHVKEECPRRLQTCHVCKEQGHVLSSCPKVRCHGCRELGHIQWDCKNRAGEGQKRPEAAGNRQEEAGRAPAARGGQVNRQETGADELLEHVSKHLESRGTTRKIRREKRNGTIVFEERGRSGRQSPATRAAEQQALDEAIAEVTGARHRADEKIATKTNQRARGSGAREGDEIDDNRLGEESHHQGGGAGVIDEDEDIAPPDLAPFPQARPITGVGKKGAVIVSKKRKTATTGSTTGTLDVYLGLDTGTAGPMGSGAGLRQLATPTPAGLAALAETNFFEALADEEDSCGEGDDSEGELVGDQSGALEPT